MFTCIVEPGASLASAVSNPTFFKDKHTQPATLAPVEVPPELKNISKRKNKKTY
jgi:hypothetical protein